MVENGNGEFELELRLIGPVRLVRRDGTVVTPKGRKAQGMLALLGVAAGYRLPRSGLQDKLWSDRGPEQGGASLRQELRGLRQALGDSRRCLVAEGVWIGLDPARVRVSLTPAPEDWGLTGSPPEFCAGLDIADPEFEDWIRDQRAYFADKLAAVPPPAPPLQTPSQAPSPLVVGQPTVTVVATPGPPAPLLDPAADDGHEPSPTIAVMPVSVHVAEADAPGYMGLLVMDVIGRLTRFRRIDVIAHASTAALAPLQLTPRQIGQRLGVRYVTQGALMIGRRRMRLTFDLIDAMSERVLWSQAFNRDFEDIFDVEEEIVTEIASGIMVEIDRQERARVRARDPDSLDAYELCLRGLDEMLRLDRSGCDTALDLFMRAESREHGYARALSGISRAHGFYWKYRWTQRREEALVRADDFALQAVEADTNDAGANAALGWVALYSRLHDRSLAAYTRAMELNPSDADILAEYADALQHSGSPNEAIPLFQRAIRLNPQMSDIYKKDLSGAYLKAGQYDEVIRTVRGMRRWQIADLTLVAGLVLAGQEGPAREVAQSVRRSRPDFSAETWTTMIPDLHHEDTAQFLEALKRAGL